MTAQESTDSKVRVSARSSIDQFKVGSMQHQNSSSFESSSHDSLNDSDKYVHMYLFNELRNTIDNNLAPNQTEFEFKANAYRDQALRESQSSELSNGDQLVY